MKNRVHYGEFTLDYWVEQLVSGHIELPEYQRSFVWTKNQVLGLLKSMSKDLFVPPVTIGKLGKKNIIIDGQQRLTSIILAYFNIMPIERKFKKTIAIPGDTEDDDVEEEHYFEWTVNTLRELGHNIKSIQDGLIANGDYEPLGTQWVNKEFLKKHYLGFSYIIPHEDANEKDKHTFFSTIFRNVNIGGTPLLNQESRKSLYYLNPSFVPLFDPEFTKTIMIKQFGNNPQPLDFLRQLAIIFDYAKDNDAKYVMKGFKSRSELYYERFIADMVNQEIEEDNSIFLRLRNVMELERIDEEMQNLNEELSKLDIAKEYNSIIDVDVYMFGLIYWILISHKHLKNDGDAIKDLKANINSRIAEYKNSEAHSKSPSSLKYLRQRVQGSIDIYSNYVE